MHLSRSLRALIFFSAVATIEARGADLPAGARSLGFHLAQGPNSQLVFAYAASGNLYLTVEHWPKDGPVTVQQTFDLGKESSNAELLGTLDCALDGGTKQEIVAEVRSSPNSLEILRAWLVTFDPAKVLPVDVTRVSCKNSKRGTP